MCKWTRIINAFHVFVRVFSSPPRRLVLLFYLHTYIFTLHKFVLFPYQLRFPRMHIWCCLYFHFPYLRNPLSVTYVFRSCIFSPSVRPSHCGILSKTAVHIYNFSEFSHHLVGPSFLSFFSFELSMWNSDDNVLNGRGRPTFLSNISDISETVQERSKIMFIRYRESFCVNRTQWRREKIILVWA